MIQKFLSNIQMIWMIFIKILQNTIQIKEKKYWSHMLNDKKLNAIVTELFIIGKKLNISLALITQSYFAVSLLNSTHYFVMKIPNKRHFQQIVFNHSSDIYFQDFMNLKKCTE